MKSIVKFLFAGLSAILLLGAGMASAQVVALETKTFPANTIVIPFDSHQTDVVRAFGLVHAILRNGSAIYRIIEPPDVTLTTDIGSGLFKGGPILVMNSDRSKFDIAKAGFPTVTTGNLTAPLTSSAVFSVQKPTKILVIVADNPTFRWGGTNETLDNMGIPFDLHTESEINFDPSIINNHNLVVVDCAAWGNDAFSPLLTPLPDNVNQTLRSFAQNGGEVIFTDISMNAMEKIFDTLTVKKSEINQPGATLSANVHNPPINRSGIAFSNPEFPSQYDGANPLNVFIFGSGRSIDTISSDDVRVMIDTNGYTDSVYRELGIYFPYVRGIVEGIEFHPGDQITQESKKLTSFFYGNKFIHLAPPGITINKTVNKSVVNTSDFVEFTLNVTNSGLEDFVSVQVIDVLPAGLVYADNSSPLPTSQPNPIIWDLGPMSNGTFKIITFDAQVTAQTAGTLVNNANATGYTGTINVTDKDDASVNVIAKPGIPAIAIDKTINDSKAYFTLNGTTVLVKLNITNTGGLKLDTVQVTDILPAGLQYIIGSASPPPSSTPPGVINWNNVGPLNPGQYTIVSFKALASDGDTTWINLAITNGTNGTLEPVTASDRATVQVHTPKENVSITKSASPGLVFEGDNVLFTVKVQNTGEADIVVNVSDLLPANLSFISPANPQENNSVNNLNGTTTIYWNNTPLKAGPNFQGDIWTATFFAKTAPGTAGSTLTNKAFVQSLQANASVNVDIIIRKKEVPTPVPAMTPVGIVLLVGILAAVAVMRLRKT